MTPLLEVQGVTVRQGARAVLSEVTSTVRAGERVAVVGPNGAGKSTLLRAIAGLQPLDGGSIRLDGVSVADEPRAALARRVAVMTQEFTPSFSFSALETVLMGRHPHASGFQGAGEADRGLARARLEALGVGALAERDIMTLSGGELQRVHFARVWVQGTPLVLLDEPTSAQDFRGARRMLDAVRALTGSGVAVVAVVHDLNLALRGFPRVIALDEGRVVADGTPASLVDGGVLERLFGEVEVVRSGDRFMVGVSVG